LEDLMQHSRVAALAGVLALIAGAAMAGASSQLATGSRVRVKVAGEKRPVVGSLLAIDERTLTLGIDERDPRIVPRARIEDLAVSAGRRSRGRGALYGAAIGAAAGALILLATGEDSDGDMIQLGSGVSAAAGVIVGAPVGALIGLAVPPGERWEKVPMDRVQVSVHPLPGRGVGVSVAVGF
jgi:hypothetical protein